MKLIMASSVPEAVLTEVIITVAECIRGHPEAQEDIAKLMAPTEPPRPALVVLLMSMVNSKQPLQLRLAVLYCTACWLYKNPQAQSELVDTLLPSEGVAQPAYMTAGPLLCGALFSADATSSWLASCALSHAILSHRDNQDKLVRVQLSAAPNQPPISLSSQLDVMLAQASSPHTRLGILQFLCCWASDSSVSCQVLLQEGKLVKTLQLLIDGSASDPVSVLIHGIASFLLGLLGMNDESVVEQIRARPGADAFLDKMAQVSKSSAYQTAAGNACPQAATGEDLQIFNAFTAIFRNHEAAIGRHVAQFEDIRAEMAEKRQKNERIEQLEALLKEKEQLLSQKVEEPEKPPAEPVVVLSEEEKNQIREKAEKELIEQVKLDLAKSLDSEIREELREKLRDEMKDEVLIGLEEEARAKVELEMGEQKAELENDKQLLAQQKLDIDQAQQNNQEVEKFQAEITQLQADKQLLADQQASSQQLLDEKQAALVTAQTQLQQQQEQLQQLQQLQQQQQQQLHQQQQEQQENQQAEPEQKDDKQLLAANQQNEELTAENKNLKEIIQELEEELEQERNQVKVEKDKEEKVEDEKAELIKQHAAVVAGMENSLSSLESINLQKDNEIKDLLAQLTTLQHDLDKKQSETNNETVDDRESTLRQEYDDLKKDQDDLLELLSDQQVKIGEYRDRLKENNLPVTDDEDLEDI